MASTLDVADSIAGEARREAAPRSKWLPLVAKARRGDHDAFKALHAEFGRTVHGIVISRVPAADAADLVQDVFLLVFQKLTTLEDDQAFPAWLGQLARNRAARHLRDHPRRDEPPEPEPHAPDRSAAPDARKVLAALAALPEAYAETLAMRLVEGMTGPEIAERTGLTPGSVRVNLHRGMALLRERLGLPPRAGEVSDE
jgi:RNA polymerase sigma-70 factor (ECF subfamily)